MRAFFRHYLMDSVRRYRSSESRSRSRSRTEKKQSDSSQRTNQGHPQRSKETAIDMHVLTRPSDDTAERTSWTAHMEPVSPFPTAASRGDKAEHVVWEREAGVWQDRCRSPDQSRREAQIYSTV